MEGDYSSAAINTGSGAVVLCQHPAAMGGEGRWVLPVSTVTPPPPPPPGSTGPTLPELRLGSGTRLGEEPSGCPRPPTAANCCHWAQQGSCTGFKSSSILLF